MGSVVLLGQSKPGSGHPWSNTPSAQKSAPWSKGPHKTKSTSKKFPLGIPLASKDVFCVIWILISPESPIWIVFQEGFGVEYKHPIDPKLGYPKIFVPYNAPPSPQKLVALSQVVFSGKLLIQRSKSTFCGSSPTEKILMW